MRAIVMGVALLLAAGRAEAQWDAEIPLTATGSDIFGAGIAAVDTKLHVVYGNSEVLYRSSSDDGATWSSEQSLGAGTLHLTDPIIADGSVPAPPAAG